MKFVNRLNTRRKMYERICKNKKRVITLLETYGLKDFINKYPDSLSGGMKQRVVCI